MDKQTPSLNLVQRAMNLGMNRTAQPATALGNAEPPHYFGEAVMAESMRRSAAPTLAEGEPKRDAQLRDRCQLGSRIWARRSRCCTRILLSTTIFRRSITMICDVADLLVTKFMVRRSPFLPSFFPKAPRTLTRSVSW